MLTTSRLRSPPQSFHQNQTLRRTTHNCPLEPQGLCVTCLHPSVHLFISLVCTEWGFNLLSFPLIFTSIALSGVWFQGPSLHAACCSAPDGAVVPLGDIFRSFPLSFYVPKSTTHLLAFHPHPKLPFQRHRAASALQYAQAETSISLLLLIVNSSFQKSRLEPSDSPSTSSSSLSPALQFDTDYRSPK